MRLTYRHAVAAVATLSLGFGAGALVWALRRSPAPAHQWAIETRGVGTAEELEQQLTLPIEQELSGLEGARAGVGLDGLGLRDALLAPWVPKETELAVEPAPRWVSR